MQRYFLIFILGWLTGLPAWAVQYTYDPLNRLTAAVYSPTQRVDYIYDAAGNLIEERTNGSSGITVTAQANIPSGGSISLSPAQSGYVAGDIVTATATPAAGYTFSGWTGMAGCSTANVCTFTVPSGNVALTANFTPPSNLFPLRTQAFPAAGGTITPAPAAGGYTAGTSVTLTATPAAGYVIDYWYGAGCTNYSGASCTFAMPAHDSDVYVVFKQVGTGYSFTTAMGLVSGATGNALAAGAIVVTPAQRNIAAGTTVTLDFVAASGYRFDSAVLYVNGVQDTALCQLVTIGQTQCSFPMPAGNVSVDGYFAPDPVRYPLDISVAPSDGGKVGIQTTSNLPSYNIVFDYDYSVTPPRPKVAAGTTVTLTASSVGSRQFVHWANGPCANSINPVCVFTMPAGAIVSNAVFSDESDAGCTYTISAPSLVFPGTGGTRALTVNTQAGCTFNAKVQAINGDSPFTVAVSGNTVNVTAPAHTSAYGKIGLLRIYAGREAFVYSIAQGGSNSPTQVSLATVNLGAVGAGDVPTSSTAITLTNTSGVAQALQGPMTSGPFAITGTTCSSSLVAGASCTVNVQFVPRRAGAVTGELLLAAKSMTWQVGLSGTGLPSRENVAAASAGGSVIATERIGVESGEAAVINGDRRAVFTQDQGYWVNRSSEPTVFQLRFASARTVEWLYLFGRTANSIYLPEPAGASVSEFNSPNIAGYSVEYWSGAAWIPVAELSRVAGTSQWQRLRFSPVTTDRLRITLAPSPDSQTMVAEAEVWTVGSDAVPSASSFTNAVDVGLSTIVTSSAVTPSNFNVPATVQVGGGSYSIGCTSTFTSAAGTINPGQSVCVRHTSASTPGATVTTTLIIGSVASTFSSTTARPASVAQDSTPDPMTPQSVGQVLPGTVVTSSGMPILGINSAVAISVLNGEYSIGCTGSYTGESGTVSNGQVVCLRHTASPDYATTVVTTLNIGSVTTSLTSTTIPESMDGVCGSANGATAVTPPSSGLCSIGSASVVGSSPSAFTWSCAGVNSGAAGYCSAPRGYAVVTTVVGGNGTAGPSSQTVAYGQTGSLTGTPLVGYVPLFSSTCGGTQSGYGFTTGAITGDCTVTARFASTEIIDHYYQSILNRSPDLGGQVFWLSEAARMAGLGIDPKETYMVLALWFFTSPEFMSRGFNDDQFVRNLYQTFFNRTADQGGLDYWKGMLAAGMPRDMGMYAFLFSPEFEDYMAPRIGTMTVRSEIGMVVDFYRGALGRLPDDDGFKYWVNRFRDAQCSADPLNGVYAGAIDIAGLFFNSSEYWAAPPTNGQYVADLYNAFMRRSGDLGGYNYWVNSLDTQALTHDDERRQFIDSPEFLGRVQAVIESGCTAPLP